MEGCFPRKCTHCPYNFISVSAFTSLFSLLQFLSSPLRNEFHFSEVYRSINYTGLLGGSLNFASDPM